MHLGLYIHIPFCHSRCPYCDFAFVVGKNHMAKRYTDAVIVEMQNRMQTLRTPPVFNTLYFGGGTPSAIPPGQLNRITTNAKSAVAPDAEITAEANPNDRKHFEKLYEHGINRLSLGVQAFTDRALKALGRFHTASDAIVAFQAARDVGFKNISVDLMYGAPGQTPEEWATSIQRAIELCPEHISVYGLTIEPQTNFARRFQKGKLDVPPETDQAEMYMYAIDQLEAAGYTHYEISNFAQPGFASRHNLNYWHDRPYLGVGLSAHSYLDNRRSWNVRGITTYIQRIEATGYALEREEQLTPTQHIMERVMLGLRQRRGLCADFLSHPKIHKQYIAMANQHLLEQIDNRIRLTRQGLLFADLVCTELVREL
ncbi:MAG: radical SAM family heme chaperone HemW [Gemmatimonadetes bacterium]|nr:radical SAM family heme chaperone HemW [Gemmatimonadota bacterium]MXZ08843.1 radical SAM family heme chaperone HemW [Gemmatimonadota bacterium]MYB58196.1 radical SAM family heme chaperone HemW [Gemmatimonadota bacterium]MYF15967.1 radical SAM family heme chaperone HemW [Gemmatimonadota bacterium]